MSEEEDAAAALGPTTPEETPSSEVARLREELDETHEGVLALYEELEGHARKLAESDAQKDRFIALLAHELRNPLAIARLASDELPPSAATSTLKRQLAHLTRLVDDLLDVSRIARGKIRLARRPVDLGELVDETLRDRESLLAESDNPLDWSRPAEAMLVDGDPVRLTQIIGNLVHNAAKHSPPDAPIAVELEATDEEVRLSIRDRGRGLAEDERDAIFELFVQTYEDPAEEAGGLGIGLNLVRRLTRLHGGRVEVDSAGRGHGAVFAIALPRLDGSVRVAPRSPPRGAATDPTARRVLLVDDEDDLRALLRARLERHGVEVLTAEDGAEALRQLRDHAVDVVLTDLGMPGMDGFALAERIHERHPDLPLVALSGYGAERDRRRTAEAGFRAHLVKPVRIEQLLGVLTDDLAGGA